jgi:dihydroorotase
MKDFFIKDANIVNENQIFTGSVIVHDGKIHKILKDDASPIHLPDYEIINAKGKYLLPGVIDEHVHFREPGLTPKGDIGSESTAAIAGGITSFMEMPNTIPQTTTFQLLEEKHKLAAQKSLANYSFYFGATNNNLKEIKKINPRRICGLKVFMGSSTGNMLVDNPKTLEGIFAECPVIIVSHCEDENTIRKNSAFWKEKYGENLPVSYHPVIRSAEACYKSSSLAVELAHKYNSRLHILHLTTKKELELFDPVLFTPDKHITAEACVHHLWFDDSRYEELGTMIKWNPAIKTRQDKEGLLQGLLDNRIDTIATDHAPHTLNEKKNNYFNSSSGGPMVQHSLVLMLELYHQKKITLTEIVNKMSHTPALLFNISKRGFIREDYWADLTLIDLNSPWTVTTENILYKCKWSPLEKQVFQSKVLMTLVNGRKVYENFNGDPKNSIINKEFKGMCLEFKR